MTKRRYLLLLLCLAIALPMGFLARHFLWMQSHRITPEKIEKIEWGMTRAEVESILGPPRRLDAVNWSFQRRLEGVRVQRDTDPQVQFASGQRILADLMPESTWTSREAALMITFDESDKVVDIWDGDLFWSDFEAEETWWQKFCHCLGL